MAVLGQVGGCHGGGGLVRGVSAGGSRWAAGGGGELWGVTPGTGGM